MTKRIREKANYQVWSRGRTQTWLSGLAIHNYYDEWVMEAPFYACYLCTYNPDTQKIQRQRIIDDYLKKINDRTAVIYDPLSLLRWHNDWDGKIKKLYSSFLQQFPLCGSKKFNGGLVLYDNQIYKGIATTLELQENAGGDICIIFKESHTLIYLCEHIEFHAIYSREEDAVKKFANIYKRRTGIKPEIIYSATRIH